MNQACINGKAFEKQTDLYSYFEINNIVLPKEAYYSKQFRAKIKKHFGFDINTIWSKGILPDECILIDDTFYVLEKKAQNCAGSVDEKLQTCGFKIRQYRKIAEKLNKKVKYCYLLSDWFKDPKYEDVLNYIHEMGCEYFFNVIPLSYFEGVEKYANQ